MLDEAGASADGADATAVGGGAAPSAKPGAGATAMGADPTGKVSKLFGVYDEATGLALRGTFIINPEGKLVCYEVNFYNVGRSAAEMVRKVTASVHCSAHPDEACPANWSQGKKALKPGAGMVGRVAEALKK